MLILSSTKCSDVAYFVIKLFQFEDIPGVSPGPLSTVAHNVLTIKLCAVKVITAMF